MSINHPTILALRDVTRELACLVENEACDHSVGICWCETFRALDRAKAILANNGHACETE